MENAVWTGCVDKSGEKVFIGDILYFREVQGDDEMAVVYCDCNGKFYLRGEIRYKFDLDDIPSVYFEKVGNVNNPKSLEMLKGRNWRGDYYKVYNY